jgi:hypothetical protein
MCPRAQAPLKSHLPLTTRLTTAAVCNAVALPALLATAVPAAGVGNGRRLTTSLTGAAERPGPGDPDGSGTARLRVNPGTLLALAAPTGGSSRTARRSTETWPATSPATPTTTTSTCTTRNTRPARFGASWAEPDVAPRRRSHPGVGGRHGDGVPLPENRFALTSSAGTRHWLGSRCRVGYVFRHMAAHDTPAARVGYVFRHMAANGLQLALHQGRPQRLPPPARRPQAAQSGSLTPDELTSTTTSFRAVSQE